MPKKVDRRILKTKRAISISLLQLLADENLDDITITALTSLADINRKTFYLHYGSIYEVSGELQQTLLKDFDEIADASVVDGVLSVEVFFKNLLAKLNANKELFRALCAENTVRFFSHKIGDEILRKLMTLYRPATKLDDTKLRYALIHMATGTVHLYSAWAMFPAVSLEDITALACRLVTAEAALITK